MTPHPACSAVGFVEEMLRRRRAGRTDANEPGWEVHHAERVGRTVGQGGLNEPGHRRSVREQVCGSG